jgi:hypothetical protein
MSRDTPRFANGRYAIGLKRKAQTLLIPSVWSKVCNAAIQGEGW